MSLTFAVPDIHGRLDLLERALEVVEGSHPEGGTVVCLGDYVDNGPDSRGVVERLMSGAGTPDWRWIILRGNHDDLMDRAARNPALAPVWIRKGGDRTLDSYLGEGRVDLEPRTFRTHAAWLGRIPLSYADDHRMFVHAGVDPRLPLDRQSEETLLNHRYGDHEDLDGLPLHLVHGHDKHPDGPMLLANRTNLDCGAWETGRLTLGVFEDGRPGGPQDIVEIRV